MVAFLVLFFGLQLRGNILQLIILQNGRGLLRFDVLCVKEMESTNHQLIQCFVGKKLWNLLFNALVWDGLCLNQCLLCSKCKWRKPVLFRIRSWNVMPFYLIWIIWSEGNRRHLRFKRFLSIESSCPSSKLSLLIHCQMEVVHPLYSIVWIFLSDLNFHDYCSLQPLFLFTVKYSWLFCWLYDIGFSI